MYAITTYMVRIELTVSTKRHYEALYVWLEDFIERRHVTLIQRFREAVPEVERYVGDLQTLSQRFTYFE